MASENSRTSEAGVVHSNERQFSYAPFDDIYPRGARLWKRPSVTAL